jgi:hypothetical protein
MWVCRLKAAAAHTTVLSLRGVQCRLGDMGTQLHTTCSGQHMHAGNDLTSQYTWLTALGLRNFLHTQSSCIPLARYATTVPSMHNSC